MEEIPKLPQPFVPDFSKFPHEDQGLATPYANKTSTLQRTLHNTLRVKDNTFILHIQTIA